MGAIALKAVSIPERVLEALKPDRLCQASQVSRADVSIPERVLEALKLKHLNESVIRERVGFNP